MAAGCITDIAQIVRRLSGDSPQDAERQPAAESVIQLSQVLDLKAASDLLRDLKDARGHNLRIDASAVEHLGAQCAQALMAAARTWRSDGLDLVVCNSSDKFTDACVVLGISPVTFCISEGDDGENYSVG